MTRPPRRRKDAPMPDGRQAEVSPAAPAAPHPALVLQRALGNRAAQSVLARTTATAPAAKDPQYAGDLDEKTVKREHGDTTVTVGLTSGLEIETKTPGGVHGVVDTRGKKMGKGTLGGYQSTTVKKGTLDAEGEQLDGTAESRKHSNDIRIGKDLGLQGRREEGKDRVWAKGVKSGYKVGYGGRFASSVEKEEGTEDTFRILTTIALEGSLTLTPISATRKKDERSGSASMELTLSGSRALTFSRRLTATEAARYKELLSMAEGSGGKDWRAMKTDWPEIAIIAQGAATGWDLDALEAFAARVIGGGLMVPQAVRAMAEGDGFVRADQAEGGGKLSADAGHKGQGARGSGSAGLTVGGGAKSGDTRTLSVMRKGGKVILALDFARSAEGSLEASGNLGGASAGGSRKRSGGSTEAVTFEFDPADERLGAALAMADAAQTPADVARMRERFSNAVKKTKTGTSRASEGDESFGLFGLAGIRFSHGAGYEASESVEDGVASATFKGTNDLGVALSAVGIKVAGTTVRETAEFTHTKGATTGAVSRTRTDYDLVETLRFVAQHAVSAWLGATDTAKERINIKGLALSDDDLRSIQALARGKDWSNPLRRAAHAPEWMAIQDRVAQASSTAEVGAALSEFVGKEQHGREEVVRNALRPTSSGLGGGAAYEQPNELPGLADAYTAMVNGDPVMDALHAAGGDHSTGDPQRLLEAIGAGLAKQDALVARLADAANAGHFEDKAIHYEMLARALGVQLQLRWVSRQLTAAVAGTCTDQVQPCLEDLARSLQLLLAVGKAHERSLLDWVRKESEDVFIDDDGQRAALQQLDRLHARMYPAVKMLVELARVHDLADPRTIERMYWPDSKRAIAYRNAVGRPSLP